ncbi:MAG: DUF1194 domain-containing protein [Proteobacteria bacterium]|nr:DUF1194 domain-containing protein [Pseudomonadota bacterium]
MIHPARPRPRGRTGFGRVVLIGLLAAFVLAPVLRADAQGTATDLQLVLAVDASGSVNQARFELQKQGYAAAFANPKVLQAIRSGRNQAIAVTMFQWTGPGMIIEVVKWSLIKDTASALAFSNAIAAAPRHLFSGGTSVSGAIDHGVRLHLTSGFAAGRRIIDVSGDGANNRGRPASQARDEAVAAGIGINGLPILSLEPDLDIYYRDNVIGGPGAFVIAITRYEDFANAILNKLITEIAGIPAAPAHLADLGGVE